MHPILFISEQHQKRKLEHISPELQLLLLDAKKTKYFTHKPDMFCYQLSNDTDGFSVDTNYFIGVDWLVTKNAAVCIEPKLNGSTQINFFKMLFESLEEIDNLDYLHGLFDVAYDQPWIPIPEQQDLLSPLLVVQFLTLVQQIVRKGLKKSYYRMTENLESRVKGKIMVGRQIKENMVRNRLTKTICNYQQYGVNTIENQFLKLVLNFVTTYLSQKRTFYSQVQYQQLQNILHYCAPAFTQVHTLPDRHQKIQSINNMFYPEYEQAIKIGGYILKKFSFNINRVSETQASTPPFWIDMSKLFELYVFRGLKKIFPSPGAISYHDTYAGRKETDILIRAEGYKAVIDCKYKPQYKDNTPSLDDKRQLAGYTRLKSVYTKLKIDTTALVKGLIIFPNQAARDHFEKEKLFDTNISEYVEFYKLGVRLPEL